MISILSCHYYRSYWIQETGEKSLLVLHFPQYVTTETVQPKSLKLQAQSLGLQGLASKLPIFPRPSLSSPAAAPLGTLLSCGHLETPPGHQVLVITSPVTQVCTLATAWAGESLVLTQPP